MSKYLVHFSLYLLFKNDFLKDNFSFIYDLTMASGPLNGVVYWLVFELIAKLLL